MFILNVFLLQNLNNFEKVTQFEKVCPLLLYL